MRGLALASLALLAACAGPGLQFGGGGQTRPSAETAAACRARADEVYNTRHREAIYAPQSQVNTPFSANYQPNVEDRGLSQLFEHDSMVSDCERNTGAEGNRTPEQRALPPPGPGPVERP